MGVAYSKNNMLMVKGGGFSSLTLGTPMGGL